jgi:hypothetical protein
MRANKKEFFASDAKLLKSKEFKIILKEIDDAISKISWGHSELFIINPVRRGNGVVPIKIKFVKHLVDNGWVAEYRMSFSSGINPGPVDVVKETKYGKFVVEWETGNISSSHRALNKIATGILQKKIIGGILILPDRKFANFLTDRVGNFEEIEPYFMMWGSLINTGIIGAYSISHDGTSPEVDLIPKGKDGNAKK